MRYILGIICLVMLGYYASPASAATCTYAGAGYAAWATGSSTANMSMVDDATGTGGCANTTNIGLVGGKAVVTDPCQGNVPTITPISITVTTATQVVTGIASKHIFVCSLIIKPMAAANNLTITEGTGTNCGTGTAAPFGGSASHPTYAFPAGAGDNEGSGLSAVEETITAADNLCFTASAAGSTTPFAATIKTVQQ